MRGIRRIVFTLLLASISCLVLWPQSAGAQSVQHTKNSADLGLRSPLKINPATNALELQIPLGQGAYPQRGGGSLPLTIDYSSRIWRMAYGGTTFNSSGQPQSTLVIPKLSEYSRLGWTFSLTAPFIDTDASVEYYDAWGNPVSQCVVNGEQASTCCFIDRIRIHMPDGSTHEFRSTDKPFCYDTSSHAPSVPDILYSVDGSRMKYQRSTNTLSLSDGSYWVLANGSNPAQYFDRHGNRLLSNGTDTLGRAFTDPLVNTSTDYTYTVPGVGGVALTYTLRWRNLDQVLTVPQDLPNFSDYCTGSNCPAGPYLFTSDAADFPPVRAVGGSSKINVPVLYQIVLPHDASDTTPPTYTFTYNVYGEIDKVVYPTGGYERFTYGLVQPQQSGSFVYAEGNRGVLERWVSAKGDGTDEAHWQYAWNDSQGQLRRGEISPDGTRTERINFYSIASTSPWSYGDARVGRPTEERVYDASGQMLRRRLSEWDKKGSDYIVNGAYDARMATRDPYLLKEVEIILDTGGQALWAMTAYEYDADLNVTAVKRYAYKSIDQTTAQNGAITSFTQPGALLRTDEMTYLVNDPEIDATTRAAYRARNLLSLPTSTRVKDGAGNIVARTAVSYDEAAYPLLTYASVLNWTNPQTNVRGLATTASAWVNTTDTWVSTHTQYDQCGSPRKIWDANGNLTQVTYSSTYKYAYPTSTTSADPDGDDPLTSLTTSTSYDLTTGRVMSQTDPNGRTTTTEYAAEDALGNPNPLQRLTKVNLPDGGWTAYGYGDQPGDLFVMMKTALDASRSTEARNYFDGLGRDWRSELVESATSSVYTDTQYDNMGRVWKVSNPYRTGQTPAQTPVWTTTAYDALGRVLTVKTPDNAQVTTSYSGNQVLVKDQAGKKRLSQTDALGRLTEVWEITPADGATEAVTFPGDSEVAAGYRTKYAYDTLGNLITVTQKVGASGTTQTRSFAYDSLSRLKSAANPESGTVSYEYDNNGNLTKKVDPRLQPGSTTEKVETTYTYDALNRVKQRNYNDATPDVTYSYDTLTNGKGRLSSVSSSVSTTSYTGYDVMGRVSGSSQTTDGQTYWMSYAYDLAGNLTSQTYPSGRVVTSAYDDVGRLSQVSGQKVGESNKTYASSFSYTPHGAVSDVKLGNTLWEHTTFNTRLQPTELGLGTAQNSNNRLKLAYDYGTTENNGNVLTQTITVPTVGTVAGHTATQSYQYDELNRLKEAKEMNGTSESWRQTFIYDRYGNRRFDTNGTTASLITENPTFNPSTNRINSGGYRYDGAGNLECVAGEVCPATGAGYYEYDAESRLVKHEGGASVAGGASYSYDGDGRRVKKIVGGLTLKTTVFVYNALGQMVAEYDDSTQPGEGGTSYLTADTLGTPRIITDASGGVKARHDYLPFGEEIGQVGGRTEGQKYIVDNVTQKFTGKERDGETGLDYFGARYYGSMQGRFTSPDDFLNDTKVNDPRSWNLYVYVRNNPLNYVDPFGEEVYNTNLSVEEEKRLVEDWKHKTGYKDIQFVNKRLVINVKAGYEGGSEAARTQLLDAATTRETRFDLVSVDSKDVAFARVDQGTITQDGKGNKVGPTVYKLSIDFKDFGQLVGDKEVKEAYSVGISVQHEFAHKLYGEITDEPNSATDPGPVENTYINPIRQQLELPTRENYVAVPVPSAFQNIYNNSGRQLNFKLDGKSKVLRWKHSIVGGKVR